jgi:hypothetical protein
VRAELADVRPAPQPGSDVVPPLGGGNGKTLQLATDRGALARIVLDQYVWPVRRSAPSVAAMRARVRVG